MAENQPNDIWDHPNVKNIHTSWKSSAHVAVKMALKVLQELNEAWHNRKSWSCWNGSCAGGEWELVVEKLLNADSPPLDEAILMRCTNCGETSWLSRHVDTNYFTSDYVVTEGRDMESDDDDGDDSDEDDSDEPSPEFDPDTVDQDAIVVDYVPDDEET